MLGTEFAHISTKELDLAYICENEIRGATPVLMCSVPGYDASSRVDDLAAELNKPITSIAIGKACGHVVAMLLTNVLVCLDKSSNL